MRTIFLLRGAPASGKSTWIEKNNLEQYTLSADKIRLLYQSPILNTDGNLGISQANDGKVWEYLFKILEDKMIRGEFVVVDATHYKATLLNRYLELIKKYRYRAYVVDFTGVPKETLLERNSKRDEYKRVPEFVIEKMCAVFDADEEVSGKFKVLSKLEASRILQRSVIYDYNEYEKIIAFGDIHGCYEPLRTYFERNPLNPKFAYIFTGDYVDRGIQNKEVLEFLISIKDEPNVLMMEGNHEIWTRLYAENCGAEDEVLKEDIAKLKEFVSKGYIDKSVIRDTQKHKIRSSVFKKETIPQIAEISKKSLRQLCRKFGQFAYVSFGEKEYVFSHGGVPCIPTIFTSTEELIKGVGLYEDVDAIYTSWMENTKDNQVLVHAHRNIFRYDAKINERIYNLCDEVEYGSPMRIIEISKGGNIEVVLEENPIFNEKRHSTKFTKKFDMITDNEILAEMNSSKHVMKKILDNGVVSYNFTRDVFNKRIWNSVTCRARGLFVDSITGKVVARSYDKFFNIDEQDETKMRTLEHSFKFPVTAYRKENGFLGIVSYHDRVDKLFVASKTTNVGDYADMVRDEVAKLNQDNLKTVLTKNNITLIFEVINQEKDPHIIKYENDGLILLDAVYNEFEAKFVDYTQLINIAIILDVPLKQPELLFTDWNSFLTWKLNEDKSFDTRHEGWVFEDENLFRTKYKSQFYQFWKRMRRMKEGMQSNKGFKREFSNVGEVQVYNLLKSFTSEELEKMSIIDIQDHFAYVSQ